MSRLDDGFGRIERTRMGDSSNESAFALGFLAVTILTGSAVAAGLVAAKKILTRSSKKGSTNSTPLNIFGTVKELSEKIIKDPNAITEFSARGGQERYYVGGATVTAAKSNLGKFKGLLNKSDEEYSKLESTLSNFFKGTKLSNGKTLTAKEAGDLFKLLVKEMEYNNQLNDKVLERSEDNDDVKELSILVSLHYGVILANLDLVVKSLRFLTKK